MPDLVSIMLLRDCPPCGLYFYSCLSAGRRVNLSVYYARWTSPRTPSPHRSPSGRQNAAVRRLLVAAERRVESLHAASRTAETRLSAAESQLSRLRQERDQCQRETQQQHAAAQRLERELAARSESLRAAQQAVTETEARRAALAEQLAALTAENKGERTTGAVQAAGKGLLCTV